MTYGVAKGVSLVPVKVFDGGGRGPLSNILAGIDWVVSATTLRPAVMHLSLAGAFSSTLNLAIATAVQNGVTAVVAAGNFATDACGVSPASEPSAITVGATQQDDSVASYSDYGTCVDLFAPGTSITSDWNTSDTATNVETGTSMAAPHVTGEVALMLQAYPAASPAWIRAFVLGTATLNRLSAIGTGSPNLLLYTRGTFYSAAVLSLPGTSVGDRNTWGANVSVAIYDTITGVGVPGAKVQGSFAPGGNSSCVTANDGTCVLNIAKLARKTPRTELTVTNVSGWNLAYTPNLNVTTQSTILKPQDD